ncbi:uncharacterized protein F5891DRAFT_965318, partial [Suillus fuscotomentosus]
VGMTCFIHSNHWLSLVIDGSGHTIYFGDSFGCHEAPDSICHAVEWWLALHTPVLFVWQPLACTRQQDQYLCGILAVNAIAHHFLPETYPLLLPDCNALDGARMQFGVAIIDAHLRTLSVRISFFAICDYLLMLRTADQIWRSLLTPAPISCNRLRV